MEDYYDLAAIGLCKAGSKFDINKSKFSTYAYRCMFTTVFKEIRDKKAEKRIQDHQITYYQAGFDDSNGGDTSTFMNYIPSKENVENSVLLKIMFKEYVNRLKERDKQIFILFSEGYKQGEIGRIVGCSQAQVSRVRKKLCKYLSS